MSSSFKNKKLSAENKKKIEHLTTICNDLLKFRKWSKYNMAKITTLLSNVDIDEPNFKFDYNKWSQRLDDNYTFYGFIRSMDKNNRMKFVDFYSEEENISLLYVREILTYNALIERYMNEDKWNWYDVLNYDYDKTNDSFIARFMDNISSSSFTIFIPFVGNKNIEINMETISEYFQNEIKSLRDELYLKIQELSNKTIS